MKKKEKVDQKKLLAIAPVFVLLVCAGIFYGLGGGSSIIGSTVVATGFNKSLPDADFKKHEPEDKLGFYEQNDRDSAHVKTTSVSSDARSSGFGNDPGQVRSLEISAKLEALNKEIAKPEPIVSKSYGNLGNTGAGRPASVGMRNDVDRLEALMKTMQESKGEDPEVTQLNGMLDKIMSIQNPQLIQQGLHNQVKFNADSQFRAIAAVLVNKQKVGQGASVKIRLLDTVRISGVLIPKGHELFALSRLANHRLLLDVSNIRLGSSIIPVKLSVYSLDGMPGIDAPEAELSNAAGSGVDDAVRGMQFLSMDQSVGVQAAGAGIDAAKNFLGRRVRRIRVSLKAGLQVLLRNNQPEK